MVTRDSDSNSAYYLFVARLHLVGVILIPSALVRFSLGIVSHLSVESSRNQRARTAGHFRAFAKRDAGWTRFIARIGELHLVLFPNGERARLFAPLVGRPSPGADLLDLALAKLQFDLTLS